MPDTITRDLPRTVEELLDPHRAYFDAEPAAVGLVAELGGGRYHAAIVRADVPGGIALIGIEVTYEAAQARLDRDLAEKAVRA